MGSTTRHDSGVASVFIGGALLGAGIALLFAPQSGPQLRGFLRDYATRAKEELDDLFDRGSEAIEDALESGKEFVEKGEESLREAGCQMKEFSETGGKAATETRESMASQR